MAIDHSPPSRRVRRIFVFLSRAEVKYRIPEAKGIGAKSFTLELTALPNLESVSSGAGFSIP